MHGETLKNLKQYMARNKQFPTTTRFSKLHEDPISQSAVLQLSHAKTDIQANRRNFATFSLKIRRKQSGAADVRNVNVCLLFVTPT